MPHVSVESFAAEESSSNAMRFVVSLSEPAIDAVTMSYHTLLNGTAASDDLYYAPSASRNNATITIAPGDTTAEILIYSRGDATDERDEAITLELFNLSSNAEFDSDDTTLRALGVIRDDDGTGPNLALFVSDPIVTEGDSGQAFASFELRLSRPATSTQTFTYTTKNGSAVAGSDYTATSGTATFLAGEDTVEVRVPVSGDTRAEPSEIFDLVVAVPSSVDGSGAAGSATILDDDTAASGPVVSILGGAASESSSYAMRFTVALDAPYFDEVTVDYRTLLNGTAEDNDTYYTLVSSRNNGTVTFAPGETVADILVYGRGDSTDESDEAITLELFNASEPAALAGGAPTLRATGVILDDDGTSPNVALIVSDPVLIEGDSGNKTAIFELLLTRPAEGSLTFSYATSPRSASAGSDFATTSGNVTLSEGQQRAFVAVQVRGDTAKEITEIFDLVVTPPSGRSIDVTGSAGSTTIFDDDAGDLPVLSVAPAQALEASSYALRYVLTLSEPATEEVTVSYRTLTDGTSIDNDLYYSPVAARNNSTVTFSPGETSAEILIYPRGDNTNERDEAVRLELYNASKNIALAGGQNSLQSIGIISDDDGTGQNRAVFVSDPVLVEGDNGTQLAVFEILLSEASDTALSLDYTTADGTATEDQDFVGVSGVVTFAPGQTNAAVAVAVSGDRVAEASEFFDLIVTPPDNVSVATAGAAGTATILDDDSGTGPVLTISGGTALEASSYAMRYTLRLSEASDEPVTGSYATFLGTADDGDTYYAVESNRNTGTFEILPGQTSTDLLVYPRGDNEDERDESVRVVLSNLTGASFESGATTATATGFILDDDGSGPNIAVSGEPATVFETEADGTEIEVPVLLSRPADEALTFDVAVTGGTAREGADFRLLEDSIAFVPGQNRTGLALEILTDSVVEGIETIRLSYTPASGQSFAGDIEIQEISIIDAPLFTNGNDTVTLTSNAEAANALAGNDNVDGAGGNDTLDGNSGNDTLRGGPGNDLIRGGSGTDTAVIEANFNVVTIVENNQRDGGTLSWSGQVDTVEDVERFRFNDGVRTYAETFQARLVTPIIGSGNADTLEGNDRNDTIEGQGGNDSISGGAGEDRLDGGDGNDSIDGGADNDGLLGRAGNDTLLGGGGDDNLAAAGGNDLVIGGEGDDNLGGGPGADTLLGEGGNDTLGGGDGPDVVDGGLGNDVVAAGGGDDSLEGGEGDDTMGASFGDDTVSGGAGNDSLGGGTGRDELSGGSGADSIGGGEGDDSVRGDSGSDFLAGGGRNDLIVGGSGNDTINGGSGNDTMSGGAGADVFVYNDFYDGDVDSILDFENGLDRFRMIEVENAPGTGLAGKLVALNITGTVDGVSMTYAGQTIEVAGVSAADLGLEDFIFL